MIKAGAQLYTAKRILIRALQNESVLGTTGLYAASSLVDDKQAPRSLTLPSDMVDSVVDSIANYAGYKKQFLAE